MTRPMPSLVDTRIDAPGWTPLDLAGLAERAARATLAHLRLSPEGAEIGLLGCDDATIAELNAAHRGRKGPTNVLSWPALPLAPPAPGAAPPLPAPRGPFGLELGDIAIAHGVCAREAAAAGLPLGDHVTHLVVHATLHLLGHDHVEDADAAFMQAREVAILAALGLPDPYLGEGPAGPQQPDGDDDRRHAV